MTRRAPSFGDFQCGHCNTLVSAAHFVSGVNNRNHCPYCLWSRHLDLFAAGDRLSACKAGMEPIGLTVKRVRNKYRPWPGGELMLVHECVECGSLSINRIAADDDPESILDAFHRSLFSDQRTNLRCLEQGIILLKNMESVSAQLYGRDARIPVMKDFYRI